MTSPTTEQVRGYLACVQGFADAIREAGPLGVGKGPLWAMAMSTGISMQAFDGMIALLTSSGLVRQEQSFRLVWNEPAQRRD